MEENGQTNPSQSTINKNKLRILFVVLVCVTLILLTWFSLYKDENTHNTDNNPKEVAVGSKDEIIKIDLAKTKPEELCEAHPEYCMEEDFLEKLEIINFIEIDLKKPSTEIKEDIFARIDNDDEASLIFTNKDGTPLDIEPLKVGKYIGVSYLSNESILVEIYPYDADYEGALSSYRYYNGQEWLNPQEKFKNIIENIFKLDKSTNLFLGFSIYKSGVMSMWVNHYYYDNPEIPIPQHIGNIINQSIFIINPVEAKLVATYVGGEKTKSFIKYITNEIAKIRKWEELIDTKFKSTFESFPITYVDSAPISSFTRGSKLGTTILPREVSEERYEECLNWLNDFVSTYAKQQNRQELKTKWCVSYGYNGKISISPEIEVIVRRGGTVVDGNIVENVKLIFQNLDGTQTKIPNFDKYGTIYYLNDNNILINTDMAEDYSSYVEITSKPDELYFYDGNSWKNLSFIKNLIKNLYFSGETPETFNFYTFHEDPKSGNMLLKFYEKEEFYQQENDNKDPRDIERYNLTGGLGFVIDLQNEKLLKVLSGINGDLQEHFTESEKNLSFFLELLKQN